MVSSKKARRTHLSAFDRRILTNVALRVSDSPQCQVKKGVPCTDGRTIFLPFDDPSLTFDDLFINGTLLNIKNPQSTQWKSFPEYKESRWASSQ